MGVGTGVSQLALSDDPLTFEHATSVLSSHALFGAGVGAAAGTAAKGVEIGLGKARTALAEHAALRETAAGVPADLANLDEAGLIAARKTEVESIKTAAREKGPQFVQDLDTHWQDTYRTSKIGQALKDTGDSELGMIAKQATNAEKQVRTLLDNPKYLADNPQLAKAALQKQEHAYEQVIANRQRFIDATAENGVPSASRVAGLDTVPAALERNRALQEQIASLTSKTSPKLEAIDAAKEALRTAAERPKSALEQMAGGLIFGKAHAVAAGIGTAIGGPIGGLVGLAAPLLSAKASKIISEKVFGRVAGASAESVARQAAAIDAFFSTAQRGAKAATKAAPVLATKVLQAVRYAPSATTEDAPPPTKGKSSELATAFNARAAEVRSQVTSDPMTGQLVMRPEARAKVAEALAPIAAVSPIAADRMETIAARRLEYLANQLPKLPEVAGVQIGPDRRQLSDMQMRQWARCVAAVEDPHAIVERLASGAVTPEDAEAMRAVYPEMMADITRQIVERLPTLRQNLPYQRRLALSLFSGVPVDPAMDPGVLSVLQSQYEVPDQHPGPVAQAAFGSVKKSAPEPTPAQQRAG